jgi:hypothetical protein
VEKEGKNALEVDQEAQEENEEGSKEESRRALALPIQLFLRN